MKKSGQSKMKVQLYEGLLVVGIIVVIVVLGLAVRSDKKNIEKTFDNTQTYLKVMENPYVNIIGHPDDGRFPGDYEQLVLGAKKHHVLLEVNNNSLDPRCTRENGEENVKDMLCYCKKYEVPVVVDSDAHTDALVGCHCFAEKVIKEVDFPEELIINRSVEELKKFLNK